MDDTPTRRDRMLENSRTLWFVALYVQTVVLFLVFAVVIDRFLMVPTPPSDQEATGGQYLLGIFLLLCTLAYIRYKIWRPLHRLARDCMVPTLFLRHAKHLALLSLPYAPVIAVLLFIITEDLPQWAFFLFAAAIIGLYHVMKQRSEAPIARAVDDLIDAPSAP